MRRRSGRRPLSNFAVGLIALTVLAVATYLGTSKDIPFTKPYQLKAVFENASNVRPNSPVRIAGVEVGKVAKVDAGEDSTAAVVTMKIQKKGLPIHEDAELKIRPRIFLEGNFFVDLRPGTPSSPSLDSGDTVPMSQTSAPVQLDQVLRTLQTDARADLQKLVKGYGGALAGEPEPGEDADQDPDTKGETAAESLNDSLDYSADALRGIAVVNDALQGTELHDLSKLIAGTQRVTTALGSREQTLKDLISNFNRTTAAFAAEEQSVRTSFRTLPRVLERGDRAFDSLNAAFPPARAFAREVLPGVRETPATIEAALPWIRQTRALLSKDELQGLVRDLRPGIDDLSQVTDDSLVLLPQVDLVSRCALENVLPAGDVVIEDGALSTGLPNYKEFWQSMTGLSSESQNFDGNGQYTRFQPGGGDQSVSTGEVGLQGRLFGNATARPIGTKPAFPGRKPPYRRDVACHANELPDINGAQVGPGP